MLQKTYITLLFLLVAGGSAFAQKSDRDYLRSGNKLYNDSLFGQSRGGLSQSTGSEPEVDRCYVQPGQFASDAAKSKRSNGTI